MLSDVQKRVLDLSEKQVENLISLRAYGSPVNEIAKFIKVRTQVASMAVKYYAEEIRELYYENNHREREENMFPKQQEQAILLSQARLLMDELVKRDVRSLTTMQIVRYLQFVLSRLESNPPFRYSKKDTGISEEDERQYKQNETGENDQKAEEKEEHTKQDGKTDNKYEGLTAKEIEEIEKHLEMEKWMDENPTKAVLPRLGISVD